MTTGRSLLFFLVLVSVIALNTCTRQLTTEETNCITQLAKEKEVEITSKCDSSNVTLVDVNNT